MPGQPATCSPAFLKAFPFVRDQLVPAYDQAGSRAFAYCQGSMVEGLSDSSDVDIICVWTERAPDQSQRPPLPTDPTPAPRVWPRQENFHVDGQEFGVAHYLLSEWKDWLAEMEQGQGCDGWPTPVIAAHGLLHGVLVHDPANAGAALKTRLHRFPPRLRTQPGLRARIALPDYIEVLVAAERTKDGLLFHGELVKILRLLWIGWFSARELYWPLEKRLTTRLRIMGREDLASLEDAIWAAGPDISVRLSAFLTLAQALLAEVPVGDK